MSQPTQKSFDYHNFLREVLRQSDERAYFLANQSDFRQGGLPAFPYRNYFYGIGLALEGARHIRIGTEIFHLKPQSVMVIGPGILREWLDTNEIDHHEAVFFTPELFQSPVNAHFLAELPIFKPATQHVFTLREADCKAVAHIFTLLRYFQKEEKLVAALVLSLIEVITHLQPAPDKNTLSAARNTRSAAIVHAFDALLMKHYLENKDVAFYAEKLQLSPNHMSEVIKAATGKSAKKRIEDLLVFEAKSLLKQTDMSIKEITYWLGFEDPSYFGKFFKQAEGLTPNEYRIKKP